MPSITPFLMFNGNLAEVLDFYASVFPGATIEHVSKAGETVQSASFELEGQRFMAFDGGPHFVFSEAISLFVNCEDQIEVDDLWEKLLAGGGKESRCGWLTDKFGVSWQVIPKALGMYLGGDDREGANRALQAMMGMSKIEVEELKQSYEGR